MEEKKWCVYMHTNKINGKKYIGITCKEPHKRWSNGNGYKGQNFYNAITKYGWNNFEHEILFNELTLEEANKKEIELIKKYNTTNKNNGYNMSNGGDGAFGFKITEESKNKMSKSHIGYKHTDESKKNMRLTNAQKKIIYQIDMFTNKIIREFESTSIAKDIMDKETDSSHNRAYISRSAKFFRYFAYGYKWIYKEDYDNKTDIYYKIINKTKNSSYTEIDKIDVYNYNIIQTYVSIKEAGEDNNLNPNKIGNACDTNYKLGGYYWRRTKDRVNGKHVINDISKKIYKIDPITREIIQEFNKMSEVNEYFGREKNNSRINHAIERKKMCDGFYWERK